MNETTKTICACCANMFDGFGEPCPNDACSAITTCCKDFIQATAEELELYKEFYEDTFMHPIEPLLEPTLF